MAEPLTDIIDRRLRIMRQKKSPLPPPAKIIRDNEGVDNSPVYERMIKDKAYGQQLRRRARDTEYWRTHSA
jgi:hypothetical protein